MAGVRLRLASGLLIADAILNPFLSTGTELIWGDEMDTKQEMRQISVRVCVCVRVCVRVFGISCSHSNLVIGRHKGMSFRDVFVKDFSPDGRTVILKL